MLSRIIAFSIRNKLIVGILVIALVIYGGYSVSRLPIDAVPDITNNQVLVITRSPSLGASDIERLVTFPIEQVTRNIPGIIEQRSFSRFGLSLVTIVFRDDIDIYWARQQISEKLLLVQNEIPPALGTPELGPVTSGLGEIFQYVIRPKPGFEKQFDALELRTIQDWIVRRQLLGTEGVADVSSFGGKLKQYEITVNYNRLLSYNLTIADIFEALEKNNQNTGGAYIEKGPNVFYISSEGLVKDEEDIKSIIIRQLDDGTPVSISDVAEVGIGHATRYGAVTYNDKGEVAGAVVMMLKGENSSKVIKAVKERIAEIQSTLPEGVIIEPFLDRTKMVNSAIGTVERNLLEGALIVVFVLVLFLGNLRAGLLVASVIPLSMLFAVIMMNIFGVSGNLMSLGALDFGLIIDGAVIIVEAVMHRLHAGKTYQGKTLSHIEMDREVSYASGKMMNAAVFGQIIILIVYLPILTLQGIEGKMFKPMAQTVSFAIIGAFLLSVTYIPMMSSLVLSRKVSGKPTLADRLMRRIENFYGVVLRKALRIPAAIIGTAALLFAISIVAALRLGGEFIPELEEGDFAVDTRVLTGSSLTTTIAATQQASKILLDNFPEVEKVVTKIGSGEIPVDPMPMEASDLMVILKPKSQWTSARSFDELAEKMTDSLQKVPGITTGFQFPVQMRFNELMTGGRQDVVCKIFGEDLDTLAFFAQRVGAIVNNVEGAHDLYVEQITGLPQIIVNYNRQALKQYGLDINTVNGTLQAAFAGKVTGQVYENERRFDLVVRLEQGMRHDVDDVRELLLLTPKGVQIPLKQVADVNIKVGPNQIQRENAQRRITIGFNVRGRDVESIVNELQGRIKTQLQLPVGYYITYGGQFENLAEAKNRLAIAVPFSLLLILLLLYFAFHSLTEGLLIYSAIPLSAIGGVFGLLLRDMPFSISAGVGFIALFGVAVLNGIVLITEFNYLKKSGMTDIHKRVLTGTNTRLRPVLMTASVASLGFLPMALSSGAGAEVQRPLATVVIGGLVSATLLTLFVLPILYSWLEKRIAVKKKNSKTILPVILLVLISSSSSNGQTPISLQGAVDSALSLNAGVKAAASRVASASNLERSAVDLPGSIANVEWGSINSAYADTRLNIIQGFSLPGVYQKQRKLLQANTDYSRINQQTIEWQLKKEVNILYYRQLVMQEKKRLLLVADSLFDALLKRQQERFTLGDINLLEKTTAEMQGMLVKNQLRQLNAEIEANQVLFSSLVRPGELLTPADTIAKVRLFITDSSEVFRKHPEIRLIQQQEEIALRDVAVQRSKLTPSFSVGYSNQSIRGIQNIDGVEKYYDNSHRFSSIMLGMNIPIFSRAQKSRIASSLNVREAWRSEYQETFRKNQVRITQLKVLLEAHQQQLDYYEKYATAQAQKMREMASTQLAAGSINYIEWMLIVNQALQIEGGYFDALNQWNETAIELNAYYQNQ